MGNVIEARFDPEFRRQVYIGIKRHGGPKYNTEQLILAGYHPAFARAIVRSITRKEGW